MFHILDVLEGKFPLAGLVDFEDVESTEHKEMDAQGIRDDYIAFVDEFRAYIKSGMHFGERGLRRHGYARRLRQSAARIPRPASAAIWLM